MLTWKAELLYKANLQLGEGAHWHPRWQKFLFVDIEGKEVGRIDPCTAKLEKVSLNKKAGTVVPADNEKLVVGLQGSIATLDFENNLLKELIKIETDKPDNRCNDGKCDPAGRLWVGTMHNAANPGEGALYLFDGQLKKILDNRSVSNGICWSNDNRTMYYIDSFDFNIRAYDFELSNGELSNERIVTEINLPGHMPDGMTIDAEGMLWVAVWGGSCVNRYNPLTGNLIGKIILDTPHVTSCAFGGYNMQQLFITTARVGLDQRQLEEYPLSGSLFMAETNIKGADVNYFNTDLKNRS